MAHRNGLTNGHDMNGDGDATIKEMRFSHIPPQIDVTVNEGEAIEQVEVDLETLENDPTELCILLENENVAKSTWSMIALAYAKQKRVDTAIDMLKKALDAFGRGTADERLSILSCLFWMHLLKCRQAPRVKPDSEPDVRTKESYLEAATINLNDASKISPAYGPLFLARGVLLLLRASLAPPAKSGTGAQENQVRLEFLRQAAKCFEDSLRHYGGRNVMAWLGKARVSYSMGKYSDALQSYQKVLGQRPDLIEPDPRIGIGCCFWQLGHREDAKDAWQRSLELNPSSKIANILLGLYFVNQSSQYATTDPHFAPIYKKAIQVYTQKAFKLDPRYPLTCATFGNHFLASKAMGNVETLARRAIELTDVNGIASDGWYILGRKEHYENNIQKAHECYLKADQARGGEERGYLPAKFGAAQIRALMQDFDGAKFRLEKIIQSSKSPEAMVLLGTLYAEDVFAAQSSSSKEDKSAEIKKATALLETVRTSWKDPKRKASPDSNVLLNLARLYEVDHPEKSLQCLQEVEQMELDAIPEEERPDPDDYNPEMLPRLREHLPPELLNNMGCYYYQGEKYHQASELFQAALNACIKSANKDDSLDTDALVTTISYSLGRTYEAQGMLDEAKNIYEGILVRHNEYVDAKIRLAYIALRQNPTEEGPKAMTELYKEESSNLEVRTLNAWFTRKAKKRTMNFNEDHEQRQYTQTLKQFDKHDRYSLTGMGNIYLQIAREMRRDTDADKQKRSKTYERAVEFFDKALQLDPKNAYAAQGIAIAIVEDKKDHATALQIFSKVRETMKDASVFINLGHIFCELKQYSRAIENYEAALTKDNRARDPQILACLGRVWLLKGKQEKDLQAMKSSLDYSLRALDVAPDQIHFKFNVAFVQIQIAQLIYTLPDNARTLKDVQAAASGLDEAIESFTAIAKSPNPPFPRHDIEQRANMGRNTMRRQLDRALQSQREHEAKFATKLQESLAKKEEAARRREEEARKKEEEREEARRKALEERQRLAEENRKIAEELAEDERRREEAEMTTDSETGEKRKREKRKRGAAGGRRRKNKGSGDSDTDSDAGSARRSRARSSAPATSNAEDGESGEEGREKPRRKKRKLQSKAGKASSSKYKSAEFVEDDDEDETEPPELRENERLAEMFGDGEREAEEDEAATNGGAASGGRAKKSAARVVDSDDEDEGGSGAADGEVANGVDTEMPDAPLGADEEEDE
ncbi:hypothetical protein K490DRAFT_41455 [Saccharata proteae CBS 121410]|uniref:TPR-like protein n=1 Tax=Saccharata proteae CBS 121410 TaxID=1314787 RepID=A0A9P4HWX0_9PEZI|nr:hypothetical protein K490DRAFT_41455 [Saccharata proteae CBS 121410]